MTRNSGPAARSIGASRSLAWIDAAQASRSSASLQIHDLDRERGFAGRQHLLDRLVVFQHETRAQDLVTLAQRAERPHERVHVQHALEQQRRGQRPAGLRRMEAILDPNRVWDGERA